MARVLCFIVMLAIAQISSAGEQLPAGRIVWKTVSGPCYGSCRSTETTVHYDGRVLIEQKYYTGENKVTQTTRREVKVSPSAVVRFRERLAPFRPTDNGDSSEPLGCPTGIQDIGYILVEWVDEDGRVLTVSDRECDPQKNSEMRTAFETAPALLEIADLRIPELG